MQGWPFEGAQVQITRFGSFGLQHRQQFNLFCGAGGNHHFADGAAVAWGEQRGARLWQFSRVKFYAIERRLSLPRYCMRATISWPV